METNKMPSFTINCPADKWPDAKRYFLLAAPNQTLNEGEANLSDDDWIKHKILLMIKGIVVKGKRIEQEEQTQQPVDDAFTIEY